MSKSRSCPGCFGFLTSNRLPFGFKSSLLQAKPSNELGTSTVNHQARRKEGLQMAGRAQCPCIWMRKSGLNNAKGDGEKKGSPYI